MPRGRGNFHVFRSWGDYLLVWLAFWFTLGGGVVSFVTFGQSHWTAWVIALAVACASGALLYKIQQERESDRSRHALELEASKRQIERLRDTLDQTTTRQQSAFEGQTALLLRLAAVVDEVTWKRFLRLLEVRVQLIERTRSLRQRIRRPIAVRTFIAVPGALFVAAKLPQDAIDFVEREDPFVLERIDEHGLRVACARLAVHQPPDRPRSSVFLVLLSYLTDEKGLLEAAAESHDIHIIRKCSITPALDTERFEGLDFGNCSSHLSRVLSDPVGLYRAKDHD